jgi:hypothetical protein
MDLHLHTPGSGDYLEAGVTYLDILRQAEIRGLDVIAVTDHNSVRGYGEMLEEIERLAFLEYLERAEPEESRRLAEYRRLLDKILVLPGFEFTATFGFHILGIFSPRTPLRQLEHILLSLNVPMEVLDNGSSNVGASSDVLNAYRTIREAGGLVIAAHVNSSHGVAMRGLDFGGQTRIAYTQDPNLHALEVTDLEKRGRNNTARFFDGTKPGYPRRMRCIQGSDAHRLTTGNMKQKDLGVGDRVTEILLPERSFEAIKEVLESRDFALTRPYRSAHDPYDPIHSAREEGETIVQSFHAKLSEKDEKIYDIIADVCAFANTNGGTVYIGASAGIKELPDGVDKIASAIEWLSNEIDHRISPEIDVDIDALTTQGKAVLRIQVPRGDNAPYAIDGHQIYIRDEADTTLAVRDEIVRLVLGGRAQVESADAMLPDESYEAMPEEGEAQSESAPTSADAPLTGVEVVGTEKRRGTQYHMMRDLRNNNIIHNVTRSSARRLWRYAIMEVENQTFDENGVAWNGDHGLIKRYKKAGAVRYDLAQRVREADGHTAIRVYYGVTEDGMHGPWTVFLSSEEETVEEG